MEITTRPTNKTIRYPLLNKPGFPEDKKSSDVMEIVVRDEKKQASIMRSLSLMSCSLDLPAYVMVHIHPLVPEHEVWDPFQVHIEYQKVISTTEALEALTDRLL